MLYISHFLEELRKIADRFTVLRDGQTVQSGAIADTPVEELVRLMAGRAVEASFVRSAAEKGDVVLELDRLAGLRLPIAASLELIAARRSVSRVSWDPAAASSCARYSASKVCRAVESGWAR